MEDSFVEHYLNFRRSINLLRQLSAEYVATGDDNVYICIQSVKQGIIDLVLKMESCETIIQ